MREFDIEFEVNQRILYRMIAIKAETPEQALEIAKHEDFDRSEAEEDTLLESWDDTDSIEVVGERITDGDSSHQEPIDPHIKSEPTIFQKYKSIGGNKCPYCDSEHIIAHPFNTDNLDAWRDVECEECEVTWRELFAMTYIEKL